jgi:hypothetical protein
MEFNVPREDDQVLSEKARIRCDEGCAEPSIVPLKTIEMSGLFPQSASPRASVISSA